MIDKEKLLARRTKQKKQNDDKTLKRVYCLYRVSNKNQVDDDDIPMQKKACHEFVQSQFGWVIKKEIEEKGISGFSVSADDRDAIVQLKDAAKKSKFDVLLVFMFDRLGRIENETPLVLRWFVEHGIEVWSVKEGQQKFDSDEDDLINYIRFWTAETESKKTSIRVKTRLHQKVEEGEFTGGKLPFGYEWTVTEKFNRRGFPVRRPSVIDKEACIVKTLFSKTINDGEGPTALANYVNSKNIKTHAGAEFSPSTVTAILKNPLYCGFYVRGNTISPRHEDLQIIEDEVYEKAQIIVNQRSKKKKDSQLDEKRVVIRTWLFGLVYCAQCGAKMSFTTNSSKRTGSDGVVHQYSYGRFICANSAMKRSECGGQGTFSSDKVEKKAYIELSNVLKKIKSEKQISKMEDRLISDEKAAAKRIRTLKHDLGSAEKELADLYEMVAPSLKDDESVKKRINTEINNKKIHIGKLEEAIEAAKQKKVMITQQIKEIRPCYNELLEMADSFGDSNNQEKAFIVGKLIDKIEVGRGLSSGIELHIKYNSNYVDLINGI